MFLCKTVVNVENGRQTIAGLFSCTPVPGGYKEMSSILADQ